MYFYKPDYSNEIILRNNSINLIKILSADNQSNIKVFNSLSYFYNFLNMDNWLKKFVIWELDIFKNFGYELILSDFVVKKKNNGNEIFYQINDKNKIIPNFLISPNNENVDKLDIINGLNIVGDFLSKSILIPNNINYPNSRIDFINSIKYP